VEQEGKLKASSLFTMIAREASNHLKGYAVPALDFSHLSEEERSKAVMRQSKAKENAQHRKSVLENSYDKKPPSQAEISEIHQMFLSRQEWLSPHANSNLIATTAT
jgi:hypothetical protein